MSRRIETLVDPDLAVASRRLNCLWIEDDNTKIEGEKKNKRRNEAGSIANISPVLDGFTLDQRVLMWGRLGSSSTHPRFSAVGHF